MLPRIADDCNFALLQCLYCKFSAHIQAGISYVQIQTHPATSWIGKGSSTFPEQQLLMTKSFHRCKLLLKTQRTGPNKSLLGAWEAKPPAADCSGDEVLSAHHCAGCYLCSSKAAWVQLQGSVMLWRVKMHKGDNRMNLCHSYLLAIKCLRDCNCFCLIAFTML